MRRLLFHRPTSKESNSEENGAERSVCDITAIKVRNKQAAKMDVVSYNGENLSDSNNRAGSKDKEEERI